MESTRKVTRERSSRRGGRGADEHLSLRRDDDVTTDEVATTARRAYVTTPALSTSSVWDLEHLTRVPLDRQEEVATYPTGSAENGEALGRFWSPISHRSARLILAHLSTWQGRPYLQLRCWYPTTRKHLLASPRAICVRSATAQRFARALASILARPRSGDRFHTRRVGANLSIVYSRLGLRLRSGEHDIVVPWDAVEILRAGVDALLDAIAGRVARRPAEIRTAVGESCTLRSIGGEREPTTSPTISSTRSVSSDEETARDGVARPLRASTDLVLTGEPEKKPRKLSQAQRFVRDFYAATKAAGLAAPVRINWAKDAKLAKGIIEGFRRAMLDPETAIGDFIATCVADEWIRQKERPDFGLAARCANVIVRQMTEVAPGTAREVTRTGEDVRSLRALLLAYVRDLDEKPERAAAIARSVAAAKSLPMLHVGDALRAFWEDGQLAGRSWARASGVLAAGLPPERVRAAIHWHAYSKARDEVARAMRVAGVKHRLAILRILDAALPRDAREIGETLVRTYSGGK